MAGECGAIFGFAGPGVELRLGVPVTGIDRAARLVEQQADALLARSEGATLLRWLEALPVDLVRCRPRLLLAQARLAIFSRRLAGADSLLDAAERARDEAPAQADEPFEPSVGRPASVLANVPATITLQRAILAEKRGMQTAARGEKSLYFTAGIANEEHGIFGVIFPTP